MADIISETVFVEIRAFVFHHDPRTEVWSPVQDKDVYSRVQLICLRRKESYSTYRVLGKLESKGTVTLDIQLRSTITYRVLDPTWHQIRTETKTVIGLRISPDSDGGKFAVVVQNILRSFRDSQVAAAPSVRPVVNPPPARPELPPMQHTRENARALSKREYDINIDKQCLLLSQAVLSGDKKKAEDLICELTARKLNLSIKLKNPVFVTVDAEPEESTYGEDNTITIKVILEDQESSGGSFSMKVAPSITTVARLKEEVCDRYGFPGKVQQWIIGRRLPKDSDTLQDLGIVQSGTTLFLYLLSGHRVGLRRSEFERIRERTSAATSSADSSANPRNDRATDTTAVQGNQPAEASNTDLVDFIAAAQSRVPDTGRSNANVDQELRGQVRPSAAAQPQETKTRALRIRDLEQMIMNHEDILQGQGETSGQSSSLPIVAAENVMSAPAARAEVTQLHSMPSDNSNTAARSQGWQCVVCTFLNTPTRPGCEICSSARPDDYVVPNQVALDERERIRIAEERRQVELFRQREEQQRQEEEEKRAMNFLTLLQTAQQALIPNREEFECAICFADVETGEGVMLRECLHAFCKDCLREHIRNSTDPEVQCPFQDDDFACHATITGQEIKALLSTEDFNKFLNRSLATAESQEENSFHCKTPNCNGWCIYEDNQNTFLCPVCKSVNCLTCKAIHPQMNCREYQDDLKRRAQNDDAAKQTQEYLEEMVAQGDAMNCPQCQIILLKKDGCDWMRCSMCRTEICWATRGRRWGPAGVGDISGGCKCRVGGKKCHPKCRNCH